MQIGWSTLGFASGTVATTVVAMTVMSLNSQQARDNAFHVCVAADRVLRLVETEEPCPEGQQRLRLAEADTPDVEPPDDADTEKGDSTDQTAKEQAAEPSNPGNQELEPPDFKKMPPAVNKVRAPFEVVDARGKAILRVDSVSDVEMEARGITIFGPEEKTKVHLLAAGQGGLVRVEDGELSTSLMAVESGTAGLRVHEGDVARVEFGRKPQGSYAARFYGTAGTMPRAAIGLSPEGQPIVMIGDTATRAAMALNQGKPQIELNNPRGQNVLTLKDASNGGYFQITDSAGKSMVEAGVDSGGWGVVRTGPTSGPAQMVGRVILVSRLVGQK
jgi:hypothetical protein